MSTLTLEQAGQMPVGMLAAQAPDTLFNLRNEVSALLATAKAFDDHLQQALVLRYAERAQLARRVAGKDTGVVHLDDGPLRVTADLPKRIEWDQDELATIVERIRSAGEDPGEFVEISYRVPETKFNAWPGALRETFAKARTLKPGKPSFRLALVSGGEP